MRITRQASSRTASEPLAFDTDCQILKCMVKDLLRVLLAKLFRAAIKLKPFNRSMQRAGFKLQR
jgi:hypothetical protein